MTGIAETNPDINIPNTDETNMPVRSKNLKFTSQLLCLIWKIFILRPILQSNKSISIPIGQTYPQNQRGKTVQMSKTTTATDNDQIKVFDAIAVDTLTSGSTIRNSSRCLNNSEPSLL